MASWSTYLFMACAQCSPDHNRLVLPQDQVSHLTSEYEDAVQRARRLSASREKILTGRGNPANLLTQDDVVIYLRWLVCHLHSAQPIHNFLRVKVQFECICFCRSRSYMFV